MSNLSIIIPYYNTPELLKKLLQTIPQQKDIEVLVIDDNSNVGLKDYELLKTEFGFVKFLINNRSTKGAGTCRNIGLEVASGKWILFADADDYFVPEFYGKVQKYFHSEFEVVFFKLTSVYLDNGLIAQRHFIYNKLVSDYLASQELKHEIALRYYYKPPYGKLINRQFILKNNIIFDEVIASNDVMFSAKVGYHMKRFELDENVIYCITRGSGSLTMNIDELIYDSRLNVFINYYQFLKNALSHEQFKALNLSGRGKVIDVLKYKLGFKKLIFVIYELKRYNIKIMDLHVFNPITTDQVLNCV